MKFLSVNTPKGISIIQNGEEIFQVFFNGAVANRIKLLEDGEFIDVVLGYQDYESFEDLRDNRGSWMFPFPNRLQDGKYDFNGKEYSFPINDKTGGNAKHGFVRESSFKLEKSFVTESSATTNFLFDYKGFYSFYPFPFQFRVSYTHFLDKLLISIELKNVGGMSLPFGFGWHPYFVLPTSPSLILFENASIREMELNKELIPTGEYITTEFAREILVKADCDSLYEIKGDNGWSIILTSFFSQKRLKVSCDKEFEFLQVYNNPKLKGIALEPMTCSINALQNKKGIKILEPGDTFDTNLSLSIV